MRDNGTSAVFAVNADNVAAKIMLAAEGPTASTVGAHMGLQAVRVVSCHMSFEIVGSGEG